jgi:hypothetical protein
MESTNGLPPIPGFHMLSSGGGGIPGMNLTWGSPPPPTICQETIWGEFVSGFENLITFKCNFKAFRIRGGGLFPR